jgi:ribonuclease BN (tRNA processing enzyme)
VTSPSGLVLTVLGAGPAWSDRAGSSGAAYLVRSHDAAVLLDLGQGSFPRLVGAHEPSQLDAVVISHLHPDHFIDLVPLRHYLAYQLRPARSVRVLAPPSLGTRIDALHDQPGFTAVSLDVEPFGDVPVHLGDLTLEAMRVTHTENSHAVRLAPAQGSGLVYSGDCGVAGDLIPLIRPGDTLLVEISFGAEPVPPGAQHLNAAAVADLVRITRPGLVLLTHLQMALDRERPVEIVRAASSAPVRLVEPGDVIELPRT